MFIVFASMYSYFLMITTYVIRTRTDTLRNVGVVFEFNTSLPIEKSSDYHGSYSHFKESSRKCIRTVVDLDQVPRHNRTRFSIPSSKFLTPQSMSDV